MKAVELVAGADPHERPSVMRPGTTARGVLIRMHVTGAEKIVPARWIRASWVDYAA